MQINTTVNNCNCFEPPGLFDEFFNRSLALLWFSLLNITLHKISFIYLFACLFIYLPCKLNHDLFANLVLAKVVAKLFEMSSKQVKLISVSSSCLSLFLHKSFDDAQYT